MFTKKTTKWAMLLAGGALVALSLGACVAQFLLDSFILRAVN